jgi:hypothetical protein
MKAGIVVLVGQQAQVGDDVLDLGLVEEGLAAGQQVGNLVVAQVRCSKQARLVVAAVEDGVVLELAAVLEAVRLQLHDHAFGLGRRCRLQAVTLIGSPCPVLGPQLLVEQLLVVAMTLLAAFRMRTVER